MCEVPGISLISFYSPHVQKTTETRNQTKNHLHNKLPISAKLFAKNAKENIIQCTVFIMQFFVSFRLIIFLPSL